MTYATYRQASYLPTAFHTYSLYSTYLPYPTHTTLSLFDFFVKPNERASEQRRSDQSTTIKLLLYIPTARCPFQSDQPKPSLRHALHHSSGVFLPACPIKTDHPTASKLKRKEKKNTGDPNELRCRALRRPADSPRRSGLGESHRSLLPTHRRAEPADGRSSSQLTRWQQGSRHVSLPRPTFRSIPFLAGGGCAVSRGGATRRTRHIVYSCSIIVC